MASTEEAAESDKKLEPLGKIRIEDRLLFNFGVSFDDPAFSLLLRKPVDPNIHTKSRSRFTWSKNPRCTTNVKVATTDEARLVLWASKDDFDESEGARYWCDSPHIPESWLKMNARCPAEESQAVILSTAESDMPTGSLTVAQLAARIDALWGGLLPTEVSNSHMFNQWLEYFIKYNLDFGMVHAWVSALREWICWGWIWTTTDDPNEEPSDMTEEKRHSFIGLAGPEAYLNSEDGEVLPNIVAPPLGRVLKVNGDEVGIDHKSDNRPRRVWDLCANRIIPTPWLPPEFILQHSHRRYVYPDSKAFLTLLSHAWVASNERKHVVTSVNGYAWPVPIPCDITIDKLREDLIGNNIRFAWLDVLCLRQDMVPWGAVQVETEQGEPYVYPESVIVERGRLQAAEWATDVPLIGALYQQGLVNILVYLNGLGREPLPAEQYDWKNERQWIRRAWTIQETIDIPIWSKLYSHYVSSRNSYNKPRTRFLGYEDAKVLNNLLNTYIDSTKRTSFQDALEFANPKGVDATGSESNIPFDLKSLLLTLLDRFASNPVDSVGGILYFCVHHDAEVPLPLPTYRPTDDPSMAWNRLVQGASNICTLKTDQAWLNMACGCDQSSGFVHQLMRLFPYPSSEHWFPSWSQVMKFPDLVQEPQIPDTISPQISCPMRIWGGFLYCNIRVQVGPNPDVNGSGVVFTLTQGDFHSVVSKPLLVEWPWDAKAAASSYVLIDITCPLQYLREPFTDDDTLKALESAPVNSWYTKKSTPMVVLCRELTTWKPPPSEPPQERKLPKSTILNPPAGAYQYQLRRVTTLELPIDPQFHLATGSRFHKNNRQANLHFKPNLVPHEYTLIDDENGGKERVVRFWDPSIVVTLQ